MKPFDFAPEGQAQGRQGRDRSCLASQARRGAKMVRDWLSCFAAKCRFAEQYLWIGVGAWQARGGRLALGYLSAVELSFEISFDGLKRCGYCVVGTKLRFLGK